MKENEITTQRIKRGITTDFLAKMPPPAAKAKIAIKTSAAAPLNLSIRIDEATFFLFPWRCEMLKPLNTSPAMKEGKKRLKKRLLKNA